MEGVFEMGQPEGFLTVKTAPKKRDRRDEHHRGWFT